MRLPVTSLYALVLLPIWAFLWISVASGRSARNVSIGDGGDPALLLSVRRHGNFVEWVCLILFFMLLAELQAAPAAWLHVAGLLTVVGRLAHPIGLRTDNAGHPLRYVGNGTNFLAIAVLAVAIARTLFGF